MSIIIRLLIEERDRINKALRILGHEEPEHEKPTLTVDNLGKALSELRRQHGRLSTPPGRRLMVHPAGIESSDRPKRTWSPEARQKQAAAMKRHWAKRRIEAARKAVQKTKKTK